MYSGPVFFEISVPSMSKNAAIAIGVSGNDAMGSPDARRERAKAEA